MFMSSKWRKKWGRHSYNLHYIKDDRHFEHAFGINQIIAD